MQIPLSTASQLPLHLKALRQHAKLSQAELAAKLQLSQSRLARMENAPERIRVEQLLNLLDALGVTLVFVTPQDDEGGTTGSKGAMGAKGVPLSESEW